MTLPSIHSQCSGCQACCLACSLETFHQAAPSLALLRIEARFPEPGDYHIHLCDQCGACAKACPVDAITLENGVWTLAEAECTGCLSCVDACPQGVMIVQKETGVPAKCTACGACAAICPRDAICLPVKTGGLS